MFEYKLGDNWLDASAAKKDVRVIMDHKLNLSHWCDAVTNINMSCI